MIQSVFHYTDIRCTAKHHQFSTFIRKQYPRFFHKMSRESGEAALNRPASVLNSIVALYGSPDPAPQFSLHVTGGGVSAAQWLLSVPGASRCVLNVEIPYSRSALSRLLNNCNTRADSSAAPCTAETALEMARASYAQAVSIFLNERSTATDSPVGALPEIFGVGCTAALVSGNPKRGAHRCHVGVYGAAHSSVFSLQLEKGRRDRVGEDVECSKLIIEAILNQANVPPRVESSTFHMKEAVTVDEDHLNLESHRSVEDETVTVTRVQHGDPLDRIYSRRLRHALFMRKHSLSAAKKDDLYEQFHVYEDAAVPPGSIIYPGSFNPLHEGHLQLVAAEIERRRSLAVSAGREFSAPLVVFEIAAVNADKPPLSRETVVQRLLQFDDRANPLLQRFGIHHHAVSVTSEPLFVAKGELFRRCSFLIGADTMARLLNPKYYADTAENGSAGVDRSLFNMISALTTLKNYGCGFIVGGRVRALASGEATFETGEQIINGEHADTAQVVNVLPDTVKEMFTSLSEDEFRLDLSSTEIRNREGSMQS